MKNTKLFKFLNDSECQRDLHFRTGFNDDSERHDAFQKSSDGGYIGIHFTDLSVVLNWYSSARYVREVALRPNEKVMYDEFSSEYIAKVIFLGPRYDLHEIASWKYLIEQGVDIRGFHKPEKISTFEWRMLQQFESISRCINSSIEERIKK